MATAKKIFQPPSIMPRKSGSFHFTGVKRFGRARHGQLLLDV
jgi:hypothetical protein